MVKLYFSDISKVDLSSISFLRGIEKGMLHPPPIPCAVEAFERSDLTGTVAFELKNSCL